MGESGGVDKDALIAALERKFAECDRERARAREELEQFVYAASHDLQEPLRSMVSFTDIVLRRAGGALGEENAAHLRRVTDAGRRMQAMLDGLLKYSRVGRRGGVPRPTSAKAAFDAACAVLAPWIRESGARMKAETLPDDVVADPPQLVLVFEALIDNALKFRSRDCPPCVKAGAVREGPEWRLWVSDNGIGIDARDRERVFGVFERLHTRAEYPGSGVGLALARRIVQRHGGRIWIEAEDGGGTRVCFTLPAVPGVPSGSARPGGRS